MSKKRKPAPPEEAPVYAGDDPARLAASIEQALAYHGRGDPLRLVEGISFYEGELRAIAAALRGAPR